ncbi:MAG TPA: carboxypeptidase regulatory-like domain-containing protein [Pyrinomonadaceae bacterium]|jgi:hypothetical protein|nr:carboxypeptidase regulatory-like domain-containing protein [Pyrinomonadaceae bacterium]
MTGKLRLWAALFSLVAAFVISAPAQVTTGNVRGTVLDPNGAAVPNANVTITNPTTNVSQTAQSTSQGEYQFNNLPAGEYTIKVEATGFSSLTVNDVRVLLNQTTDVPTLVQLGSVGEVVEVSAGGAELVDTTTTNLSRQFSSRQAVDLAQTGVGFNGVNNLALLAPNVSSSGGVGVGSGGSVGGQRPRNNNFVVDGVDNNDKSVTGPQIYISPENVAEFSLLQNQFSAEHARSNGGQFITVTKSGTNEYHGTVFGFFRNRYLNALDNLQKQQGFVREDNPGVGQLRFPRSDFFRGGFNVGGPLYLPRPGEGGPSTFGGKDRLFFFAGYERRQSGDASSPGGVTTPTAAGFALLNTVPGLSQNNLAVFKQYVPVAATNDAGTIDVGGVAIPIGNVGFPAPSFDRQNNVVTNFDFIQSENTSHRVRFNYNNYEFIDTDANLPAFFVLVPNKQRLFSYTLTHNLTSNVTNETRLAYRRSVQDFPVGDAVFPGLTTFPNIGLLDLGLDVGPNPNYPQGGTENNYQVVNNTTYLLGNHSLKFGADFRRVISPQVFVQRQRGDYQYNSTDLFLRDISPDFLAERNVGTSTYIGNQTLFFPFVQDDWRVRPNLTLNLGLNYSYQGVPRGAADQARNSISSVPGLIEFGEPRAQKKNFAPKVGLAYSPNYDSGMLGRLFGSSGKTSIRLGFSLGYDYIFDNLYILSAPPQSQQTAAIEPSAALPGFLGGGGIPDNPIPITDAETARAVTGSYIPDQEVPYSITYTASLQREFLRDYSIEFRYLHTRGVHLLTQNRINRQAKANPQFGGLPTFLAAPSQTQLDALTLTLDDIDARSSYVPAYENAGFFSSVVGFLSNGNSVYDGGSVSLQRRFSNGAQLVSSYTFSHLIDDTTAEVFSTVLSPRRVEDFQNLRADRADSALDRRHRFVFSGLYDLPFFNNSSNGFVKTVLGGFRFAGTLTFESGQKATVLSGIDSNLNGDAAGDRSIINPAGVEGTGSTVTALTNSSGQIVGYLADNPNAQYIRAGLGAVTTAGRNTLQMPGINNLDFSVFKNFAFGETRRIQLRADFLNAFNHPQYIPGSVNDVTPIATTGVGQINTLTPSNISNGNFNSPSKIFSSNPRVIQMALRFDF